MTTIALIGCAVVIILAIVVALNADKIAKKIDKPLTIKERNTRRNRHIKGIDSIPSDYIDRQKALLERQQAHEMKVDRMRQNKHQEKGQTDYQIKYLKLLSMLNADNGAADRLISAYGIDRAISDLERDRRVN